MTRNEIDKLALKIVASDRQMADGLTAAIAAYCANRKATARIERLILLRASLRDAIDGTTVKRPS